MGLKSPNNLEQATMARVKANGSRKTALNVPLAIASRCPPTGIRDLGLEASVSKQTARTKTQMSSIIGLASNSATHYQLVLIHGVHEGRPSMVVGVALGFNVFGLETSFPLQALKNVRRLLYPFFQGRAQILSQVVAQDAVVEIGRNG